MPPAFSMQEAIDNTEALRRANRHIEILVILANGCKEHTTYRGKMKVVTDCKRCNEIYGLRQRLIREGVIDCER
ncbi:MAG: hypothetical protein VR68_11840 [Peptococcaceae bacterium BRH_c4a]|nr:MAG: hypothetical protein VR68_11840 [Peptococcaceae bacterium BRH_c4a]